MASLSDKRLAEWLEQVADGLDAGMQASNAVALAKTLPTGMSQDLEGAFQDGGSWGESLQRSGLSFSFAELAILKASELSGRLPAAMRKIAVARRELLKVKRRMLFASLYPVFLLHFAALIFSITYLVDGDVPAFFVSAGMIIVPAWLITGFAVLSVKLFPELGRGVLRGLPVFSSYRKNWEAGILCDVLASGMAAGMDVNQSWDIAANAADSPKLYQLADSVIATVSEGGKASEAIAAQRKFSPSGFEQLYRSGEETGSLEENLEAAAKRFFSDAKSRLMIASILYPKILLVGIFGYVGYKIVMWVKDYFEMLSNINA